MARNPDGFPRITPMLSYDVIDGVHVYVEDVDKHFARAKEAGATILSEPSDQPPGDRHYRAEDLEGHRGMFSQHTRDVPAEEWSAVEA